jgi:hypothetical protein
MGSNVHFRKFIRFNLSILCSLEYKSFCIEILHRCTVHHWLTVELCFQFKKEYKFSIFENKEILQREHSESDAPISHSVCLVQRVSAREFNMNESLEARGARCRPSQQVEGAPAASI